MLTGRVDAHKRTNMAVAIDAAGRAFGALARAEHRRRVAATGGVGGRTRSGCPVGDRGAWNYGRGWRNTSSRRARRFYEVNARWTAAGRRRARTPGKSDRLDARAVALVVWPEAGTLPAVAADDETGVVDLLVTEREGIVAEATRLRNQLHQLLLQLDPDDRTHIPSLKSQQGLRALAMYATEDARALQQQRCPGRLAHPG